MKIRLEEADAGTFLLVGDDDRDLLVQTDWDFPGVASTFGWSACACGETDGTVDCVHRTTDEMIADAQDFLRAHAGDIADDPGYF
jgi:hypothetical protein